MPTPGGENCYRPADQPKSVSLEEMQTRAMVGVAIGWREISSYLIGRGFSAAAETESKLIGRGGLCRFVLSLHRPTGNCCLACMDETVQIRLYTSTHIPCPIGAPQSITIDA